MGGYDGQTVAGVISTSTHGSGIGFGPLPEQIRSLDVVAGGGAVYRIERGDGPTDPAAFVQRYPERRLVQDDDWFSATVVGMGCMGVIYAAMLAAEQKYWLKEVRVLRSWREVRADLRAGDVLRDNRHYEFLFNPYEVDGTHQCLVTTRNKTRSEEHTSELQSPCNLVCRLLLEKKKKKKTHATYVPDTSCNDMHIER